MQPGPRFRVFYDGVPAFLRDTLGGFLAGGVFKIQRSLLGFYLAGGSPSYQFAIFQYCVQGIFLTGPSLLLQKLPEKDDRKTRLEAAKLLEKDFKKAMQKGYSAKEISTILKNEGIIIPAYLVTDFLSERGETSRPQTAEQCPQRDTSPVVHDSSDA